MDAIYTITTLVEVDVQSNSRCVGWYPTQEQAHNCVVSNCCDIHEGDYEYVVIEAVGLGVYSYVRGEWWYKWDRESEAYQSIEKPESLEHVCGFGIG